MTRAESMTAPVGVMATRQTLEAADLGRWPAEAMARPPVWAVRHTGTVSRVQRCHTDRGVLRAATGRWGRVVPAGRP
jgi:hypothetical protein